MLLWAMFTMGYLFGVFFTLGVFLKKDVVEGVSDEENASNLDNLKESTPWEIFTQLTKINHPKAVDPERISKVANATSKGLLGSNTL